jgi:hypothetical protein
MEPFLAESLAAVRHGTGCRTRGEYAVDARGAHAVVAFGVDEELERGIQVAVAFADRADVRGWIVEGERFGESGHLGGLLEESGVKAKFGDVQGRGRRG